MIKLLLVGSSGHAGSVIDLIDKAGGFQIAGLVDSFKTEGTECHGYPVVGGLDRIPGLAVAHGVDALVVAIGHNWDRFQVVERIRAGFPGARFPALVHPSAVIGRRTEIGQGTVVLAGAVINANTSIGDFCIVNTRASVDHDCELGPFSSVAPGATLGGNVRLGAGSAVCIGATVIQGVTIGRHSILGAGAVLLRHLGDEAVAYGVPARFIRSRAPDDRYL